MQPLGLLPFATYPDAISEKALANAVALATLLGVRLHALAISVDIPDVSNRLSELLLDLPTMIRQAEQNSRARGLELLDRVGASAERAGQPLTNGPMHLCAGDVRRYRGRQRFPLFRSVAGRL